MSNSSKTKNLDLAFPELIVSQCGLCSDTHYRFHSPFCSRCEDDSNLNKRREEWYDKYYKRIAKKNEK